MDTALGSEIHVLRWKWPPFFKWGSLCRIEWCDTFGNNFSEIYAPQNLYIESTLNALRLLVSEIDVILWKWPPFCKMAFTISDRMVWYTWQYFFCNLRLTKPIYKVEIEGSAPLRC